MYCHLVDLLFSLLSLELPFYFSYFREIYHLPEQSSLGPYYIKFQEGACPASLFF